MNSNSIPALLLAVTLSGWISTSYAISEVFDHMWLYEEDSGAVFGNKQANGHTYGWTGDNSASAYDRNNKAALDERYDGGVVMGDKFWEIAVQNGTYTVLVVAGEPEFTDAVYKISIEGQLAVDGIPKPTYPFVSGMVTVPVTDGRITISSAAGSKNNRLAYVHITSPLHGAYPTPAYASVPLRIDVGNLGGFPFKDEPGYVHDKMWVENSDYGYFSPTGTMARTSTGVTYAANQLNLVYTTYLKGTFGYRIRVHNGTYRLVLKFSEPRTDNTERDNSDIIINGDTLIRDLDIVKVSGGMAKPFDTTVTVKVTNQLIELKFRYLKMYYSPILNAIELLPGTPSTTIDGPPGVARFTFRANQRIIILSGAEPGDRLLITSLDGRSLMNLPLNRGQTRCSIPGYQSGTYLVRYVNHRGTTIAQSKFVELSD